jgi:hypothetical protein
MIFVRLEELNSNLGERGPKERRENVHLGKRLRLWLERFNLFGREYKTQP